MNATETKARARAAAFLERAGRFAERHRGLLRALGGLEARSRQDELDALPIAMPVFVAGLARSGSTMLLMLLAETPGLVTHRYRDFPFLETPLWWSAFYDRAFKPEPVPAERFHKDRILVTPESPEALEEMLWMSFFPGLHDSGRANTLGEGTANPAFESFLKTHVRKLLLLRGGKRYLSKANYHVARLSYLADLFPDARFVVPFREPRGHIASLMKQHRLFCEQEAGDPRVLHYMRRSGHFEFGLDRRPIHVGHSDVTQSILERWAAGDEVGGWARYWADIYGFILSELERDPRLPAMARLVSYEDLCATPRPVLEGLYGHCDLRPEERVLQAQAARLSSPAYYAWDFSPAEREVIERETAATHDRLRQRVQTQPAGDPSA